MLGFPVLRSRSLLPRHVCPGALQQDSGATLAHSRFNDPHELAWVLDHHGPKSNEDRGLAFSQPRCQLCGRSVRVHVPRRKHVADHVDVRKVVWRSRNQGRRPHLGEGDLQLVQQIPTKLPGPNLVQGHDHAELCFKAPYCRLDFRIRLHGLVVLWIPHGRGRSRIRARQSLAPRSRPFFERNLGFAAAGNSLRWRSVTAQTGLCFFCSSRSLQEPVPELPDQFSAEVHPKIVHDPAHANPHELVHKVVRDPVRHGNVVWGPNRGQGMGKGLGRCPRLGKHEVQGHIEELGDVDVTIRHRVGYDGLGTKWCKVLWSSWICGDAGRQCRPHNSVQHLELLWHRFHLIGGDRQQPPTGLHHVRRQLAGITGERVELEPVACHVLPVLLVCGEAHAVPEFLEALANEDKRLDVSPSANHEDGNVHAWNIQQRVRG
mmetsp:Transcript_27751/g.81154  ORF Transcript_27751/g.81154 Transcript_27751/m.81154 type:complete len:432 (+) Transcript_27751:1917-3212(+)